MMLRRFGLVGVLVSSLLMASCVTDSATVYITGAVKMNTGGCILDANGDLLVQSVVDASVLATGSGVDVGFTVGNLVRQRTFNIATDVSTVIINQAEITLGDSAGNRIGGPFIIDLSAGVIPGSVDGLAPGRGIVVIPVIPSSLAPTIAALAGTSPVTVFASIIIRGRTNGHLKVEGGPFSWAISIRPSGAFGADCSAVGGVPCCNAGQDGEAYCTDSTNIGLCLPSQ